MNEESDPGSATRNTVWLIFSTGSGTDPYLEINVKNTRYTVALEPDTAYNYQLAGSYWADGGVTSIRLVAGGVASEYIYITFPEIINTDAALQEVENADLRYYMQGKSDEATELRSQTIKYANGRDYYIGWQLQRVIEFVFASSFAGSTALLTATICFTASGIAEEANVTVRFRVNRTFDEIFVPVQTIRNGKHILTLCYPVSGITPTNRNQVDIYLQISDGEIEVLQQQALATITASGLATSGDFTGEIEILEIVEDFNVPDAVSMEPATDAVTIGIHLSGVIDLTDTAQLLTIQNADIIDVLTDRARIVNYEGAKAIVTENGEYYLTLEDGDYLFTEQEHT